jgi:H+/gluconate symporter-like permease
MAKGCSIILNTSAGGSFGAMSKHTGVAETIKVTALAGNLNYVLIAWLVLVVLRLLEVWVP